MHSTSRSTELRPNSCQNRESCGRAQGGIRLDPVGDQGFAARFDDPAGQLIVVATGVLLAAIFWMTGTSQRHGGGQMPDMLIRLALAAAIVGTTIPAWGAGMPDLGTKNFSPGGDAPSYFSNENGVMGTAAGEAWDDGEDAAISSASETSEPAHIASRYHGRLGAHQSRYHRAAYARLSRHTWTAHPAHYSTAADITGRNRSPRTAGVKSIHHAWARSSSRKG